MKTIFGSALAVLLALGFSLTQSSAEETQSGEMRLYPVTTIEWKAGPAALPPGARMAVLEGDPTKEGPFVVRFQFPEGYHVPSHTLQKPSVSLWFRVLFISPPEKRSIAAAQKNFRLAPSVTGRPA